MSNKSLIPKLLPVIFVVLALTVAWLYQGPESRASVDSGTLDATTLHAPHSGQMVEVTGRVSRLLADDNDGNRHQRFILALREGRTLLVAHNIDLAPRVPVETGDMARVRGQYEHNERGGVLHWTHHDPDGHRRDTGWIEHHGKVYE